jgi:uncharacterized protein involved in exopolysaccharide biosynthesis
MSRTQVLAGVVVGLVVAIALGVLLARGTPTYQSTALLSIDEPLALAASDDAGVIDKLSRLRAKYVGLVATTRIREPVAASLAVPVGDLHLSASAPAQNLLIQASATSPRRADAHRTADALAAELVSYVADEQRSEAIPAARQVQLAIVQPADTPTRITPRTSRVLGGAVLGGGVAGLAAAGVAAALGLGRRRPRAAAAPTD